MIALTATESEIEQAVALLNGFNVAGFIAAFNAEPVQARITAGENALNVALSIAGLFFPPAAVAENYVKIVELAANIIVPLFFGANPLIKFAPLVPINHGYNGWVSVTWQSDKRHWLNADGSFQEN